MQTKIFTLSFLFYWSLLDLTSTWLVCTFLFVPCFVAFSKDSEKKNLARQHFSLKQKACLRSFFSLSKKRQNLLCVHSLKQRVCIQNLFSLKDSYRLLFFLQLMIFSSPNHQKMLSFTYRAKPFEGKSWAELLVKFNESWFKKTIWI